MPVYNMILCKLYKAEFIDGEYGLTLRNLPALRPFCMLFLRICPRGNTDCITGQYQLMGRASLGALSGIDMKARDPLMLVKSLAKLICTIINGPPTVGIGTKYVDTTTHNSFI